MWETVVGAVSSLFTGGATGLLSGLLSRWLDQQERKDEGAQERAKEVEIARIEADARVRAAIHDVDLAAYEARAAEAESRAVIAQTDNESLKQALESDKATYGNFMDYVRAGIRPALTGVHAYYLWLLVNSVALVSISSWTNDQKYSISLQIIENTMHLGNMIVGFWFGHRTSSKRG